MRCDIRTGLVVLLALVATGHECLAAASLKTGHENLLFVAAADGSIVHREQDNLSYELEFDTSDGGINIVGVSLIPNTLGSATFFASPTGPATVTIELVAGSAAPADYHQSLSGTLNLSWSHDGAPGNTNLNFEFRAIDSAECVVFDGYTTTSAATSDITPITIGGTPPFGATQYVWTGLPPVAPVGLSFSLVGHDGIFGTQTRRWVRVSGGPVWDDQNTTFKLLFGNQPSNMVHKPIVTCDLRLRSFQDLTVYQGQTLYSLEGPISATGAAPGGYDLAVTTADGSSLSLDPALGSVAAYSPAGGWDTDTTADVEITDGDFCTTLTVRDVDVRFRALKADGYTLFRGHQRGEGVIDTGLPHDGYHFAMEGGASAFPVITLGSGVTPALLFEIDGSVTGILTAPPDSHWNSDDTFNLLIKDGARPRSRVPRAVSFRKLPSALTWFEQQIATTPATAPSAVGNYVIAAVDPAWLGSPPGTPPVFLGAGSPRPDFGVDARLLGYLDGDPSPTFHTNTVAVADGLRPLSAGAPVTFHLRHFTDGGQKIDGTHPLGIPANGGFTVDIDDAGDTWLWAAAALGGFTTGSVSVAGAMSVSGLFNATDVDGTGALLFDIGPNAADADHPVVSISLPAKSVAPSGVEFPDEPGLAETVPGAVLLAAAYPNPFNPRLMVRFGTPGPGRVVVEAFDGAGRRVATIVDAIYPAGYHEAPWTAVDRSGRSLAAGTYLLRVRGAGGEDRQKVMLVR